MGFLKRWFYRREKTENEQEISKLENDILKQRRLLLKQRISRLQNMREEEKLRQESLDLEDELSDMSDDDEEETEEENPILGGSSPEAMLMNIINTALQKKGAAAKSKTPSPDLTLNAAPLYFSDDEIKKIIRTMPASQLATIKNASDSLIKKNLMGLYSLDEETADRAIKLLRKGNI